jgi:hypothetical protein
LGETGSGIFFAAGLDRASRSGRSDLPVRQNQSIPEEPTSQLLRQTKKRSSCPGIDVSRQNSKKGVDGRVKPGHDEWDNMHQPLVLRCS